MKKSEEFFIELLKMAKKNREKQPLIKEMTMTGVSEEIKQKLSNEDRVKIKGLAEKYEIYKTGKWSRKWNQKID